MLDFRKAQSIINKIKWQYQTDNKVKWNDIYNSMEELTEELKQIVIPPQDKLYLIGKLYGGYSYIHSFAEQLQNGKTLTDKQLTQCKRLALEIKKAYSIKDCYN